MKEIDRDKRQRQRAAATTPEGKKSREEDRERRMKKTYIKRGRNRQRATRERQWHTQREERGLVGFLVKGQKQQNIDSYVRMIVFFLTVDA